MKRIALQKAADHLELAKAAVDEMATAENFKAYERAWSQFLAQASRFYSKLEQGAKGCKASEPWFGGKKHERKKDPLLSYLHHARDCEEHTIDHTASISADMLRGYMPDEGDFKVEFQFMVDDKGRQHYRDIKATGPNGEELSYELVNPKLSLLQVRDKRFGDKFDPPLMHRGKPIVDTAPRGIASLAVTYLKEMLADAGKLPEHF